VQLVVLTQQMLVTQKGGIDHPHTHLLTGKSVLVTVPCTASSSYLRRGYPQVGEETPPPFDVTF
jgi:hypothetical protein